MSKDQSTENKAQSTQNETKPRTKSNETVLKQSLRAVRRDLVKAKARGEEFAEIKKEMDGHEKLLEGLLSQETALKADLIKALDLG